MLESSISMIKDIAFAQCGDDLLKCIVCAVSKKLDLDYVFIIQGDLESGSLKTLAAAYQGKNIENVLYELKGTPCQKVFQEREYLCSSAVQSHFPEDETLLKMSIEGYVGHVLEDKNKKTIGLIAGLSKKKIEDGENKMEIFSVISKRISLELEQIQTVKVLKKTLKNNSFLEKVLDEHNLISSTDRKGNITYVNEKFCVVSGYSREELLGKNHRMIKSHGHQRDFFIRLWRRVSSGKVWSGVIKNVKKDGSFYWVSARIAPIYDDDGKISRYIAVRTDITSQKILEEKALELKNLSEKLAESKGLFLANMSHEIRTPINGIQASVDLLLDTELSGQQKELSLMIHHSMRSLNVIVNDILDFSKLESGKVSLERIAIDYQNIINDVVKVFAEQAQKNNVELVKVFPQEYPDSLLSDPTRLRQILVNLVSNAIKFSSGGRVSITVDFKECSKERCVLKTTIKDTGIGMSQEEVDRIFDTFTQADVSTTRRYGGTGLGASICKKLIDALGGEVFVKSKPNEGTEISFEIPVEVSKVKYVHGNLVSKPKRDYGKTIILAEDNKINQKVATMTLKKLGITVLIAKNGKEAVDLAMSKDHELILMDIQMPVMSGLEACKSLISRDYRGPIVAMTANVMKEDVQRYKDSGMVGFIPKPFDFHQLVKTLDKFLNHTS